MGPRLVRFEAHLRNMSGVEEERRVLSGRMHLVVVLEFHEWQESHPIILPLIGKKTEILFQFLLGDAPHCPMSPPIFLHHLCIFLLIVASPRQSALVAPIPESDDHVM